MGLMSKIAESRWAKGAAAVMGVGTAALPVAITYEMLNPPAIHAEDVDFTKMGDYIKEHCLVDGGTLAINDWDEYVTIFGLQDHLGKDGFREMTHWLSSGKYGGGEIVGYDLQRDGWVGDENNPDVDGIDGIVVRLPHEPPRAVPKGGEEGKELYPDETKRMEHMLRDWRDGYSNGKRTCARETPCVSIDGIYRYISDHCLVSQTLAKNPHNPSEFIIGWVDPTGEGDGLRSMVYHDSKYDVDVYDFEADGWLGEKDNPDDNGAVDRIVLELRHPKSYPGSVRIEGSNYGRRGEKLYKNATQRFMDILSKWRITTPQENKQAE